MDRKRNERIAELVRREQELGGAEAEAAQGGRKAGAEQQGFIVCRKAGGEQEPYLHCRKAG